MDLIESGEWIADLGTMTCRNYTKKITEEFEKQGEAIIGKMSEVPDSLTKKWGSSKNGKKVVNKILKEAEEVFLMVYYGNELEKCCQPDHSLKNKKRLIMLRSEMNGMSTTKVGV
jgi:hypothetical protein